VKKSNIEKRLLVVLLLLLLPCKRIVAGLLRHDRAAGVRVAVPSKDISLSRIRSPNKH
jgi:hypothetical protein